MAKVAPVASQSLGSAALENVLGMLKPSNLGKAALAGVAYDLAGAGVDALAKKVNPRFWSEPGFPDSTKRVQWVLDNIHKLVSKDKPMTNPRKR